MTIRHIKKRNYVCNDCGHEVVLETNHQGPCYPICKGSCRQYIVTVKDEYAQEHVLCKQTQHNFVSDAE